MSKPTSSRRTFLKTGAALAGTTMAADTAIAPHRCRSGSGCRPRRGPRPPPCRSASRRSRSSGKAPASTDGGGGREAAVRRRIARVVGRREQRLQLGIELRGPDVPVGILGVPAGDAGIEQRDVERRQHPRRGRGRWLPCSRSLARASSFHSVCARAPPLTSQKVARWFDFGVRANALELGEGRLDLLGVERRRCRPAAIRLALRRAPTAARSPRPTARSGLVPFHAPGPSGTLPRPHRVGAIRLAARDGERRDALADQAAGRDVARELRAGQQAHLHRLLGLGGELGGARRKQSKPNISAAAAQRRRASRDGERCPRAGAGLERTHRRRQRPAGR